MAETEVTEPRPTAGAWLKSFFYKLGNVMIRWPLATALTVVVVAVAVLCVVFKIDVQVGGLLGRLWGKKPGPEDGGPVLLPPPPGRVDDSGNPIQPGQPDDKGYVQLPAVLPIEPPHVFSDPSTVTVVDGGKKVVLPLPEGVKNGDVKGVTVVSPNVYQVANNDRPSVDTGKLLEELGK